MEISDQALARENNPSHPTAEEELRVLNKQLREQADQLRALNQDLVDREARLRLSIETGRVGVWRKDKRSSMHRMEWFGIGAAISTEPNPRAFHETRITNIRLRDESTDRSKCYE